ncbi:MAG: H-NS histone family protein [Magnetococcales bacterium]|nr:H-NS histone family protein [Magnetococcales bacterium]
MSLSRDAILDTLNKISSKTDLEFLIEEAKSRLDQVAKDEAKKALNEVESLLRQRGLNRDDLLTMLGARSAVQRSAPMSDPSLLAAIPPLLVKRIKDMAPKGLINPHYPNEPWGDPNKKRWHMPTWLEQEINRLRQSTRRIKDSDIQQLVDRFSPG